VFLAVDKTNKWFLYWYPTCHSSLL